MRAAEGRRHRDGAADRLATVLQDPHGLEFTVGFVDRVVRTEDVRAAGRALHEPLADQGDGLVGQGAGVGDGRGVGGHGGTLLEAAPGSGAEALPRPPAASTGRHGGR